jgi:ubiquinone/menaquinone biosynthesis C-methylase UbiE
MNPLKRIAERTPWFDEGTSARYQRQKKEILQKWLAGARVLEVGCGSGELGNDFCVDFKTEFYLGADYSAGMARDAKMVFPKLNFICADVVNLPFQDHSFDIVHSAFLFHHLKPEIRQKAIMEKLRVSKRAVIIEDTFGFGPGFFRLPHRMYYSIADGSHYRYTIQEWHNMFSKLNLKIIDYFHTDQATIVNRWACWVISSEL